MSCLFLKGKSGAYVTGRPDTLGPYRREGKNDVWKWLQTSERILRGKACSPWLCTWPTLPVNFCVCVSLSPSLSLPLPLSTPLSSSLSLSLSPSLSLYLSLSLCLSLSLAFSLSLSLFDWYCFCYSIINSLVALLQALFVRILFLKIWDLGVLSNFFGVMMMVAFITFNSNLVLLIEGRCNSFPYEFESSGLDGIEPTT